jgi:hypothetical protein
VRSGHEQTGAYRLESVLALLVREVGQQAVDGGRMRLSRTNSTEGRSTHPIKGTVVGASVVPNSTLTDGRFLRFAV